MHGIFVAVPLHGAGTLATSFTLLATAFVVYPDKRCSGTHETDV
jgi:hypothetical protein